MAGSVPAAAPPASPPAITTPTPRRVPVPDDPFGPDDGDGDPEVTAFARAARWSLLGTVLIVLAVGLVNARVDPQGIVGTGAYPVIAAKDSAFQQKLALIDEMQAPPQVVLLGSSRGRELDPHHVRSVTGRTAFNAAISAGRIPDAYAIATHIDRRFPESSHPGAFPKLVWGIDVEAFDSSKVNPRIVADERFDGAIPLTDQALVRAQVLGSLLDLRMLPQSAKSLQLAREGREVGIARRFDQAGFRRRDPYGGRKTLDRELVPQVQRLGAATYNGGFRRLTATSRAYTERTIALANRRGTEPTLFITPMHQYGHDALGPRGYDERHRDLVQWLQELQQQYRFTWVDLSQPGSWGATDEHFYDGVHLTPAGGRLLLDELARRDAL